MEKDNVVISQYRCNDCGHEFGEFLNDKEICPSCESEDIANFSKTIDVE